MVRMDDALAEAKLKAKMLLQVHDELVFEVPDKDVAKTLPVVKQVMEDAPHPGRAASCAAAGRGESRRQLGRGALAHCCHSGTVRSTRTRNPVT